MAAEGESLLDKLDAVAPIQKFDAFPKVQSNYKAKSTGGGFWTLLAIVLSLLLVLNDIHEYIYGWPDYEFAVDTEVAKTMIVNVDMIVNMPCHYLSVDLRDAVGERLHLSNGFRRDGTIFDPKQARALQSWSDRKALMAREAVALSRKSRGFFSFLRSSKPRDMAPTYNYRPDGSACRVYGSIEVKKVTANLHITTAGHGYGSPEHTDHSMMNLSHIITEFSFGPYIPDIVQPLDYSFEITEEHFAQFQYFITVVPTTYYASPGRSVKTNQYSVTHYTKTIEHGQAVPGIFFRFDIDPMAVEIHQRTTLFHDFFIRVVGVIGGVWVCAQWAFKIGGKAAEVVTGKKDDDVDILSQESRSSARKSRWVGGSLNKRPSMARLGGWDSGESVNVGSPSWTASSAGTPVPYSPYAGSVGAASPGLGNAVPPSPYSQWAPTSSASNAGFPTSPLPPVPQSAGPYTPSFSRSVSGASANTTLAASQVPIPLSPGSPYTPPAAARPSPSSTPSHYAARSTSNLNPNRSTSGGPPISAEKKDD